MKTQIDWRTKDGFKPTRSFNQGEMVIYGRHDKTEIIGTDNNGATYKVRCFGIKKVYGVPTSYDELQEVNWYQLFKISSRTDREFAQDRKFRMVQSERDISGLLSMVHCDYAGVDFTPDYQRDYVWTDDDKVKLIDSIFNNITIGLFVFAKLAYTDNAKGYEIIDGKQRLTALVDFFEDRFTYQGLFFSQLSNRDMQHFENYGASIGILHEPTEKEKLAAFLAVNTFGRVMDEKHLESVRIKYNSIK